MLISKKNFTMKNIIHINEEELIVILNKHYKKLGFVVNQAKKSESIYGLIEVTTEPIKDFAFNYNLEKLRITDHLLEKVFTIPTQKKKNIFNLSSINKDDAKKVLKKYILNDISEKERMLMIEIYELCPQTICKGAPKNSKGQKKIHSLNNLYQIFPWTEARKMVPVHRRIINDLRNILNESQNN